MLLWENYSITYYIPIVFSDNNVIILLFCRSGYRGRYLFGEIFMYYRWVWFYRCSWKTVPVGRLYFRIHIGTRNRTQVSLIMFLFKGFLIKDVPYFYYYTRDGKKTLENAPCFTCRLKTIFSSTKWIKWKFNHFVPLTSSS